MKALDTTGRKDQLQGTLPWAILTVAGISFCFWLGFPFDNHNESFLWIPALNHAGLMDTLKEQVVKIESFRPLGMANAWLGYKLSGNIYLQQLLNWLFAIGSFLLLFRHVYNKPVFSILSFVTGACFFSGYIYLFHLHGVFYGPFQLYVAWLAVVTINHSQLSAKWLLISAIVTLVASLYHTFALLAYCAFLGGYLLQLGFKEKMIKYLQLILLIVVTVAFAKLILQSKAFKTPGELAEGFMVSYRMAEINRGLSLVALILCLLTAAGISENFRGKIISMVLVTLVATCCLLVHLPLLVVWVLLCLIKELIIKNFALAGVIAATAILPLGSASGSPTYVVFVIMICCFSVSTHALFTLPLVRPAKTITGIACIVLLICALMLRNGIALPVLAGVARPILAEQEKTRQMQTIIDWKLNNAQFAGSGLRIYDAGGLPVQNSNAASRTNRPVAGQDDVSAYIDFLSHDSVPNNNKQPALYVTFGDKILPGKTLVFVAPGKWNGKACVYQ